MGVLDEVPERPLERAAIAADESRPVGLDDDAGLAVGRLPRHVCDVDRLVRHGAGVLAGESQEIVQEPAQPLRVGVDVGQRLGVGAVGKQVRRIPAQRGDRVSQLVRGVCDESPLGLPCPLERGEHAVQRLGEPVDLLGAATVAHRQAERCVARLLDHGGACGEPLERPAAPGGRERATAGTPGPPPGARRR